MDLSQWRSCALALLITISTGASSWAQNNNSKPAFTVVDIDGNGQISLQEARSAGISEKAFTRADRDRSGYLTVDEYNTMQSIT